jgi:hypothetical protein
MCFFSSQQQTSTPVATAAPTKSDAQVQSEAEKKRLKNPYSTEGFAATILTGGLGASAPANVKGITLGS